MPDYSAQNRRHGAEMLRTLMVRGFHPRAQRSEQYIAHCPFHEDHSPSLSINVEHGIFNCFGCHVKGTYWDFQSALRRAGYVGFSFIGDRKHEQRVRRMIARCQDEPMLNVDMERVRQCHAYIVEYWHMQLLSTPAYLSLVQQSEPRRFSRTVYMKGQEPKTEVFEYVSPRFSIETIKRFNIGFAPVSGVELTRLLKTKGYTKEEMIATGLLRAHGNSGLICPMAGHVVYPYLRDGRPEYAIGRITDNTPKNLCHSKYTRQFCHDGKKRLPLRSPPIFNVGLVLHTDHAVLITEGITDAIKATEAGVPTIALGTTTFQREFLKDIASMLSGKTAIVCFDTEESGVGTEAASKVMADLQSQGSDVCIVSLPKHGEKTDICSFILSQGAEAFHNLIEGQTGITFRSNPSATTIKISSFLSGRALLDELHPREVELVVQRIFSPLPA